MKLKKDAPPKEPKKETLPEKIPPMEELYTPAEVATSLRVGERVILDLLRRGQLGGLKVGKAWRIRESDLKAYVGKWGQSKGGP